MGALRAAAGDAGRQSGASRFPTELASDSIRQQLAKILASKTFARTERLSRFLRFTAEKVLQGQGDQLKEYLIGLEVFDRKSTYDPRLEPIVRTEARRLRAKLRKYYETEGRHDPIGIEFPTGGYAPVFHTRPSATGEPAPLPARPTIAVLPFVNLSAEPDDEYFSDGLTEELIHALTKVESLRVVAWTTVSQFKGKAQDIRKIGRQLNVNSLLEGSVRRSGDRLRITAQLFDVADGYHLWSEKYDREARDVFVIQDEISRAIVDTLRIRLAGGAAAPLVKRYTENLEAHNLYLKGLFQWNKQTEDGLKKSIEYFQEAIAREPNHAPAYVGLSFAYELLGVWSVRPPHEVMPRATAAAVKALQIDGTLADAHAALAATRAHYEWDWAGAEHEFRLALALKPGGSRAHQAYAMALLIPMKRFDEALTEIRRAQELDPLSMFVSASVGHALYAARRHGEAIEQCRRTIDLERNYYLAYVFLGEALEQEKMYAQAIEAFERARALSPGSPLATADLGRCYALAGNKTRAYRLLQELEQIASQKYASPMDVAQIHIGLGDHEAAFQYLQEALQERSGLITWIPIDARYDTLREDPRFAELVQALGLDQ